jgi:hypothetical protein
MVQWTMSEVPSRRRSVSPARRTGAFLTLTVLLTSAMLAGKAAAHTSEQVFVLLLPTRLYTLSGVAVVALTVVVLAFVPARGLLPVFASARLSPLRGPWIADVASFLSFVLLVFLVFVGLYGPRDPFANGLTLSIWTVWWIILLSLQALFGDLWRCVNPWQGLYRLVAGNRQPPLRLSERIGLAPALVAFFLFTAFMLADIAPDDPSRLAVLVSVYWVYVFAGMLVFGGESFLSRGDFVTVLMRCLALVSVFQGSGGELRAGLPGWRIVALKRPGVGLGLFALTILAVGSFDGLNETFWWLARLGINPLEFPGRSAVVLPNSGGLALSILLVIALFAAVVAIGERMAGSAAPLSSAFARFAPSVLPITVGYHIAHYLTSLLVNAQYALKAATDPFADGSDYLGLGTFYVTTGFFNTLDTVHMIWITQASAVVLGHVLAICVSHAIALDLYKDPRKATLSQVPSALFMIAYTTFGLWLLAAPRGA